MPSHTRAVGAQNSILGLDSHHTFDYSGQLYTLHTNINARRRLSAARKNVFGQTAAIYSVDYTLQTAVPLPLRTIKQVHCP